MKKIAVLGYGVVGSGVVELFYRNQKKIEKNTGTELEIGYILDLREFPDDPYGDRVVHDIQVILDDPEVGYVAECMGGVNPAFDFVRRCLEAGKSVATSNKQLVAEKGDILLQVAKAHHVNFFFEASVGGAIPIIRPLHTCLAANDISAVAGILNGTTNFILEKMFCDKMRLMMHWHWHRSWAMQSVTPPRTLTAAMPAGRSAFCPRWYSASMYIRNRYTPRVFATSHWKTCSWHRISAVQ